MDRALIEQYAAGGAALRRAVAGLSPDELGARPGPGAWSVLEVVIHLADSDAISIDRMKRILTEDDPPLLYADESAYVERLHTHQQDVEDALVLFEVGRRQWARVLRLLPDDAFLRHGTHNRRGRVTLGELVAVYVKHVDDHLVFIDGKRANLGTDRTRGEGSAMPEHEKDEVTDAGLETVRKAREAAQEEVGGVTAPGHRPGHVGQPETEADQGEKR